MVAATTKARDSVSEASEVGSADTGSQVYACACSRQLWVAAYSSDATSTSLVAARADEGKRASDRRQSLARARRPHLRAASAELPPLTRSLRHGRSLRR